MRIARSLYAATLLASICFLSGCAAPQPIGSAAATAIEADTFRELDGSLRTTYARAQRGVAGAVGQMAAVDGRSLTLWRGSEATWSRGADASWRYTFGSKLFEQYAFLRQVPLRVFELASSQDESKQTQAAAYASTVRSALDALDTSVIPPGQLPDQRTVLQLSIEMLDRLAAGTETSTADIDAFVQRVLPAFRRNFNVEAAATTAALGVAVQEMRTLLLPGEWERLYVAVEDRPWPQLAQVRYEYLAKLLGQNAKGRRLFLLRSRDGALSTTHLRSIMIEDDLSRVFFGHPYAARIP